MPPLRYDANAKVQEEPDMKMVMLVRRVRVRPTLIFQSRVEGDLPQPTKAAIELTAPGKTEAANKKKGAENTSVMNRVKTFIKSLWSPSS
jgi:hypothetical protein